MAAAHPPVHRRGTQPLHPCNYPCNYRPMSLASQLLVTSLLSVFLIEASALSFTVWIDYVNYSLDLQP